MEISLNWIKDFVDLDMPPAQLMQRLTLSTCEVEGMRIVGESLQGIKVVKILAFKKHPEADKLNLVTFQLDQAGKVQKEVVCGAPNVRIGMYTAFAPVGHTLPGGLKLEAKKIRGILSEGMLCSEVELGLSKESAGIIDLQAAKDLDLGKSMVDFLQLKSDVIFEVDNKSLTHRPDLWGHYGMAREFAAFLKKDLKNPFSSDWQKHWEEKQNEQTPFIKVKIQGESSLLSYIGINIEGVEVGPSPSWLKERLESVGMRSISNLVDVSNYVMNELGIPNHIFDAEKISGEELIIRRLGEGEDCSFTTLDGIERKLVAGDTVIADKEGPQVLAGIMGGLMSSVSEKTQKIFIEVANWRATEVRKTSSRLALRTDSSQRYEKCLDSNLTERTLWRIVELVQKLCPKAKVVGQLFTHLQKSVGRTISLDLDEVSSFLGKSLKHEEIEDILKRLDFSLQKGGGSLVQVQVPTSRDTKDIQGVQDLMEEIGRMVGFDHIEPVSPLLQVIPATLDRAQQLQRKIQDFMVLRGEACEVMSHPLVGVDLLQRSDWPITGSAVILNAVSVEQDRLRPSMMVNHLQLAYNNQKFSSAFRLFELGRHYTMLGGAKGEYIGEKNFLQLSFFSREENLFTELLDVTDALLRMLQVKGEWDNSFQYVTSDFLPKDWKGVHPFERSSLKIRGKTAAVAFSVHPQMMRQWKMKGHLAFLTLDLSEMEKWDLSDKRTYREIPKFPGSEFDCTVVVDKSVMVEDVLKVFKKCKLKEFQGSRVVDVYELSATQKTITLRSSFLDAEQTLSSEFLDGARKQIVTLLHEGGFPLKTT